jgi:hypothetical protein
MKSAYVHRTRFERGAFAAGALICYAAAALLAPSGASSQLTPAVSLSAEPVLAHNVPVAPVAPARDAFAPRIAFAMDAPPPAMRLLPTPPPLTAHGEPGHVESTARVTAIVTGQSPRAIVEIGGVSQAVGIGDRLAGARIITIDAEAIGLDNGTQLQLAPAAP